MWRWLSNLAWIIANTSLMASALILIMQVVSRYVFNYSFAWVEELARYLIIYMVLVGSALVIKEDEHPRIDFIYNLLGKKLQFAVAIFFAFCTLAFLFFMIRDGWNFTQLGQMTRTPSLRIKWAYPRFALPLGAVLMAIFTIKKTIDILLNREGGLKNE